MSLPKTCTAAVQVADCKLEMREFRLPDIGPEDGLLRVERAAICGSDILQFRGELDIVTYPTIPGHEPIGVIAEVGDAAARRWGVRAGDRVVVASRVPCLRCRYCHSGNFNLCSSRIGLGTTSTDLAPSIWGAYSEYLYLPPNTQVYKVSSSVPLDHAATFNAMAGGIAWAAAAGVRLGDTVVVLGCGQRGLTSVIAAKAMGAGTIVVTGLTSDAHKLHMARELGADYTVDVGKEDIREFVKNLTHGDLADIVIEVVPFDTETVVDAIEIVKPLGTVILAGHKGNKPVRNLITDRIERKAIRLQGVTSKVGDSYRQAVRLIESGKFPLDRLHTHTFALDRAEEAIETLAGNVKGEKPIFVSIAPH